MYPEGGGGITCKYKYQIYVDIEVLDYDLFVYSNCYVSVTRDVENEDYISRGVDYNCICIVFLYLASLRPCLNLECHWNGFLEPQGTFYTALNIWVIYDQLALKQINILNIHHNLHVSICVLLFFFLAQLHVKTCILKQYKTCSILTNTQDYNPFKPYTNTITKYF